MGSWLLLNRPATSGLMEKAALWKIEKRELEPADTHLAASSSTVFLSVAEVGAGTQNDKGKLLLSFY